MGCTSSGTGAWGLATSLPPTTETHSHSQPSCHPNLTPPPPLQGCLALVTFAPGTGSGMHADISNATNLALALDSEHLTSTLATWFFIPPKSIPTISKFFKDPQPRTDPLAKSIRKKYPTGIAPPR